MIKEVPGYDLICDEVAAVTLYERLMDIDIDRNKIPEYLAEWAVAGARLTRKHPSYPTWSVNWKPSGVAPAWTTVPSAVRD